ncbi:hypothetical protein QR680_000772 [Steinernema hermaphroditum]|uniref:Uncharacterized protein n=1 Tax=Steinernema hermaphroditum TaxID=289476 RepID=A0AA39GWM5_9BILA|nr:hypothetical protein QR680_000772 [Steinernema hermaphroditum]
MSVDEIMNREFVHRQIGPDLPPTIDPVYFLVKSISIVVILRPRATLKQIKQSLRDIYQEDLDWEAVEMMVMVLTDQHVLARNEKGQFTADAVYIQRRDWIIMRRVLAWKSAGGSAGYRRRLKEDWHLHCLPHRVKFFDILLSHGGDKKFLRLETLAGDLKKFFDLQHCQFYWLIYLMCGTATDALENVFCEDVTFMKNAHQHISIKIKGTVAERQNQFIREYAEHGKSIQFTKHRKTWTVTSDLQPEHPPLNLRMSGRPPRDDDGEPVAFPFGIPPNP